MSALTWILLLALQGPKTQPAPIASAEDDEHEGFLFEPGRDGPRLHLPRNEKLVYRVFIDLPLVEASVGTVTQTCKVVPYQPSVLIESEPVPENLETASIQIRAKGDYSWYSLDSTIETRLLPQFWPRILHKSTSEGTEKRSRELKVGSRDGVPMSSYRRDTETGAPKGTRIWKDEKLRTVPEGAVDLLSAIFFARTLVQEGHEEITFPLIDKDRVWEMTLRRGQAQEIRTPAGVFDAIEVRLDPKPYRDEAISEAKQRRFEGLFGIHGTIHLWAEMRTGVPVRIQGDLPVGPLTLGIDVALAAFEGTPPEFEPRRE